ncbi:MAG: hypothetical protein ACRER2_18325 [Methylococcales bacterium]
MSVKDLKDIHFFTRELQPDIPYDFDFSLDRDRSERRMALAISRA